MYVCVFVFICIYASVYVCMSINLYRPTCLCALNVCSFTSVYVRLRMRVFIAL